MEFEFQLMPSPNVVRIKGRHRSWWEFVSTQWTFGPSAVTLRQTGTSERCDVEKLQFFNKIIVNKSNHGQLMDLSHASGIIDFK